MLTIKNMNFDIRKATLTEIKPLIEKYHGYKSLGRFCTYALAVIENNTPVAAFVWMPPPLGPATEICPNAPYSVLALSRMVAVPKTERVLKHISKPLKYQMKYLIDRTRWPVLITYSDEGQGHTGYTYQCSGWTPTIKSNRKYYLNEANERTSNYCGGENGKKPLTYGGITTLQRWEHRACSAGEEKRWLEKHGWEHVVVPGKVWKSGNQAYRWVKND